MDNPRSILIVDDDLGMLKTLHYILTDKGYEVVTLNSGYEAVELIKKRPFDIVLSDIKMPGMNGVETLKEIKRISPGTDVMMITAYTMHELVHDAKQEGALAVFPKPLELDKIISHIEMSKKGKSIPADNIPSHELFQILEDKEQELKEKNLLIDMLKKELSAIKKDPTAMLEEARRKKQGENIHAILKTKQLGLFKMLWQGEKSYEEIFKLVTQLNLDIRDLEALRLQLSRLEKKLRQETNFHIKRIRRDKTLYLKIESD